MYAKSGFSIKRRNLGIDRIILLADSVLHLHTHCTSPRHVDSLGTKVCSTTFTLFYYIAEGTIIYQNELAHVSHAMVY